MSLNKRGLLLAFLFLSLSFNCFALPKIFTLKTTKDNQKLLLDSFESENQEDIDWILENLKTKIATAKNELNENVELKLNIDETLRAKFESDPKLIAFLNEVEKIVPLNIHYDKVPNHPIRKAYRKFENMMMKNARWSFTLFRAITIGAASVFSMKLSDGLPWDVAIYVGALTGALTGGVQFWAEKLYTWMDSSSKLSKKAGAYLSGLLSKSGLDADIKNKESWISNTIKWSEKFGKYYATEVTFVSLICTAMYALSGTGCSADGLFMTSLLATLAQGTWDFAITTNKKVDLLHGEREKDADFSSRLSYLSVAIISTGILTLLKLLEVPHADLGFYALGAGGAATLIHSVKAKAKLENEAPKKSCQIELLIPSTNH